MTSTASTAKYRLISQNRDDQLTIEIVGTDSFLLKYAEEILADENLLSGFSRSDVQLIKYIAAKAFASEMLE